MRSQSGFTLVEVLVAFTLLAMVVAAVFSIFAQGGRVTAQLGSRGEALRLAESHLADLVGQKGLRPGSESGRFSEQYRWQREIRRAEGGMNDGLAPPWHVALTVSWDSHGQNKRLQLYTLVEAQP